MRMSMTVRRELWGGLFIFPAMVSIVVFNVYPMLNAFYLSLSHYDLLRPPELVGFSNYVELLGDSRFWLVFGNTFGYAFGRGIPLVILALGSALVLGRPFRLCEVYRTLYFTPVVLSGVVVAIVWALLYSPNGVVNQLVSPFTGGTPVYWLTQSETAPYAIIIMAVWQSIGFYMIVFIAGLQGVPAEFYEAAAIDGASAWHRFRHITVPLLSPTTVFVTVICVINGFQAFTYQFVMTDGGPSDATNVLSLLIYHTGLQYLKMGLAAAMSLVLFVAILILTLIQLRIARTEDVSYM
jgi:multiple sugar transport system permease protein